MSVTGTLLWFDNYFVDRQAAEVGEDDRVAAVGGPRQVLRGDPAVTAIHIEAEHHGQSGGRAQQ